MWRLGKGRMMPKLDILKEGLAVLLTKKGEKLYASPHLIISIKFYFKL